MGARPGLGVIAFLILFFCLALWFSGEVALTGAPGVAIGVIAVVVILLTLIDPEFGIYGLIFGMLLSPEIEIPWIPLPSRKLIIRIDDLMIILTFLAWFARQAATKSGELVKTPLNRYLIAFAGISFFSTTMGILNNSVPHALTGYLFVLKFTEFFLLYFLLINVVRDEAQFRSFVMANFATVLVVCAWASYMSIYTHQMGRAGTPFETEEEPATLGGYLLFFFALAAGLFTYSNDLIGRMGYLFVMAAIIPPMLYTQSRATYMAFFPTLLALLAVSNRKALPFFLILVGLGGLFFLPQVAIDRLAYTFENRVESVALPFEGIVQVDPSSAGRLVKYQEVFAQWLHSPLWGQGVTGVGFVDSQIFRVFGELGIIGVYLLYKIFQIIILEVSRLHRFAASPLLKGAALGYIAGTIGLLIHATSSNTFVVVRIAGPFWLITGLILGHAQRVLDTKTEADSALAPVRGGAPRFA